LCVCGIVVGEIVSAGIIRAIGIAQTAKIADAIGHRGRPRCQQQVGDAINAAVEIGNVRVLSAVGKVPFAAGRLEDISADMIEREAYIELMAAMDLSAALDAPLSSTSLRN